MTDEHLHEDISSLIEVLREKPPPSASLTKQTTIAFGLVVSICLAIAGAAFMFGGLSKQVELNKTALVDNGQDDNQRDEILSAMRTILDKLTERVEGVRERVDHLEDEGNDER